MSDSRIYDVAIVGGGIAGAGAGAMLAEHCRCILLEAEDQPGYHSTGRSAATFILNYGNAPVRALNKASEDYLQNPPQDIAEQSLLSARGHLSLADEQSRDALAALRQECPGLEPVTSEQAVAKVSILKQDRIAAGAYEPDARDIDVNALHQGWLRRYKRAGGALQTRSRVTAMQRQNGVWILTAGDTEIQAKTVINAAGAWADEIAGLAGLVPIGLTPLRRSIAVLPAPEGHDVMTWPLVSDVAETWYMKPDAGQLFVSPADEDPVEAHDVFADDTILAEGLHRFEQATKLEVTRVLRTWAGLRTFAPDRTPVNGFDPTAEGFFWLAGQGGYGIQTAPAMSRLAAALILGQATEEIVSDETVTALSPARFRT